MGFMETSAKLKVNIEETFDLIIRRVVEARRDLGTSPQVARQRVNEKVGEKGNANTRVFEEREVDSGCKCCVIC